MTELWRDPTAPIWILDNRDSFVFNLAHRFFEAGVDSYVVRSTDITVPEIEAAGPRALVISPGPGHPVDAGISVRVVEEFAGKIPMLGVCLGHQAIVHAFGGEVAPNDAPVHGRASEIRLSCHPLFRDISSPTEAARYHSLALRDVPSGLEAIAWLSSDDTVMAVSDASGFVIGTQFHPESILTPNGLQMLRNFLEVAGVGA